MIVKACLLALALGLSGAAGAVPITYAWQGSGTGSLNGVSFTDTAFTITALADTDGVVNGSPGNWRVFVDSAEVAVSGLGTDTLTGTIGVVSNQTVSRVGISNFDLGRAILFVDHPSIATYDLTTSFGPVTGSTALNAGFAFPTGAGTFSFSEVPIATFQAAAVPEPATMLAMGGGLALLFAAVGVRRRC